ncbi:MAG: hypothetical protein RBR96_00390 [Candidatus Izemoplasmatales bacterium]|jgi:hypothetical protein|nr:hypothetical protein [Candidatus Izemoplasmatales bacterium]
MQDIYQKLNKDYSIDEIVEDLTNVPGDEISKLLTELDINFPRSLRFSALQKVLYPILESEYNELLKSESDVEGPERLEESRRQTRLTWIDSFSETQYENELYRFNNKEIDQAYIKEFWKKLLNFLIREGIPKKDIAIFLERVIQKYQSNQSIPPIRLFQKALDPHIYDEEGTFDGLNRDVFAKRVVLSATISELKQIGSKFDIKVPTRLTKIQVLEIVIDELKARNEYIPDIHLELTEFNLKELEEFARLNNIIAFAYINKDQMIEYMYKEFDEKNIQVKKYKIDEAVAEQLHQETVEIQEELEEKVVEETVKEEVKPIVVEEKIEENDEDVTKDLQVEEAKPQEAKTETIAVDRAIVQYDKDSLDELKKEIISLKEIVLELQAEVNVLRNETIKGNAKLDKVTKGLIPVWFKRLVFVLIIITLFFMIYVPLAYYYPNAPVISQINFVFDKIPFLGGSTFLEFLLRFFQRLFGV